MKKRSKDEGSHSGEARTRTTRRQSLSVVTGLVALLVSVPFCHASPSPEETECIEEQPDRTPAEILFRLYNDNLIVVKGSIGRMKEVNFILDTGTSPTIITETIAAQLKLRGQTESLVTERDYSGSESHCAPPPDRPAASRVSQSRRTRPSFFRAELRHFLGGNCWPGHPQHPQL